MTGRRLSTIRPVLTAIAFASVLISSCNRAGGEPWVVGHLSIETGPSRDQGVASRRGITLAVEQANDDPKSRVAGRKTVVLHADTKGEDKLFNAQAVRLAGWNHAVAVVGGFTAEQTREASLGVSPYSVLLFTTGGIPPGDPRPLVFALALGDAERSAAAVSHLANSVKSSRTLLVHDGAWPRLHDKFDAAAKKQSLQYERLNLDASPDLSVLKNATAIVLALPAEKALETRAKFKSVDVNPGVPTIFIGPESEIPQLQAHPEGTGLLAVTSYVADDSMPKFREFAEAFQKRFNEPANTDAARSYDAMRLLLHGAAAVKSFDAAKLRANLREMTEFQALNGPMRLTPDQTANSTAYIVRLTPEGRNVVATIDRPK